MKSIYLSLLLMAVALTSPAAQPPPDRPATTVDDLEIKSLAKGFAATFDRIAKGGGTIKLVAKINGQLVTLIVVVKLEAIERVLMATVGGGAGEMFVINPRDVLLATDSRRTLFQ
ncbi:MAG: hypothetical protein ABIO94_09025 [Opitutaceae bacterium]